MMGYLIIIKVDRKQCNHVFQVVMMAFIILVVVAVVRRKGGGVMVILVIKFIYQPYSKIAYCVPFHHKTSFSMEPKVCKRRLGARFFSYALLKATFSLTLWLLFLSFLSNVQRASGPCGTHTGSMAAELSGVCVEHNTQHPESLTQVG